MKAKTIEILDRMTCIPALAIQLTPGCERDRALLAHAGYGLTPLDQREYVILVNLTSAKASNDPYAWGDRTMTQAHLHIVERFDRLTSGDVVDVECVLGETPAPRPSEIGR